MAITVRLPTAYKKFTDGVSEVEFEPGEFKDVGGMAERLFARWPKLRAPMYERGELGRHVNVFVNGVDTRFIEGRASRLEDGDEVQIVLAIAGGV